ncbi:MAG TPA: sigma 54-interacting transcriptional regulator [Anaeromyxobacter sp.]|nr:sigma 54-interacting transcriptional regulator [Anaeromyxobacter sp.]
MLNASECDQRVRDGVQAAVAGLRAAFDQMREVVAMRCETGGRGSCEGWAGCAGYAAMRDVLDLVAGTEQHLVTAAERAIEQGRLLGQLSLATQGIASMASAESLVAAIPELALLVCCASAAALLRVAKDGAVAVVSRCGARFEAPQARMEEEARGALEDGGPRFSGVCDCSTASGHMVAVPLGGSAGMVLELERAGTKECFLSRDLEHVLVYASLAGTALARARAAAELQEAAARDAAILGAIREGVIAVDRDGVVRALNQAGAAALGVAREEVVGRALNAVPGLAPLAAALSVAPGQVMELVSLARGDVVVRAQLHEGGVVATIRDAATEHTIAHRLVGSTARYTFEQMVGEAPGFLHVVEEARRAARSDVPILICGESGTGKELLAQAIHNASAGASGAFIGINVTAIPRELLESELFGYEGGTFTGARATGRAGKFELAGRGTILLDEIGDMPLEIQSKLLRVLQERVVQRLGSARDVPVRARIVATTHRNLFDDVRDGRFRLDLFHRLCVLHLVLPPLRDRRDDVPRLVEHQLRLHAERTGRRVGVAPHVLAALMAYDWPGNVRQLMNVIEGELSVLDPREDRIARVPPSLVEPSPTRNGKGSGDGDADAEVVSLDELERRACERTLAAFHGNVARAAQALGVAKGTLYSKMKRYGLGGMEAPGAPTAHRDTAQPHRGPDRFRP